MSEKQLNDILTKSFGRVKFLELHTKICLIDVRTQQGLDGEY
jgi:hypothetical protein